ncbi:hypothetical protein [Blastococcus sp. CCUG 61487]|uniref:hypothetical protein n=1 Tax=Blastococcus sp. CCUG 61487 TaxID=1840703 RepID=UPI0010C10191|nr:hypothetical protein [Blastococcus sp. CCUG 61487]TKJ20120.1 hypothetical protein A6V29_09275 [Blastococcus sp. CCUG 61487]
MRHLLRIAGLVAGVGLVLLGGPALTPAAGPAPLPLTVDASLVRSGEIGVEGAGLLVGAEVRPEPGGAARGRQGLVSQTSVPVDVTLQDVGPPTGWEEHLWLRIALGDAVIFHGPRSSLRQTTSSPVRMAPGTRADVDVEVSLPPGAPDVHQGRRTDVRLLIASTPVPPAWA